MYNVSLKPESTLALRSLRLWHWQQAITAARYARDKRTSRHTQRDWQEKHALHMKSVQTLNDLFPIDDTAEKDSGL